jgi:phosphatidylinositol glycan class M
MNPEKKVLTSSTYDDETLVKFLDAVCWLYNPLAINICTRGSAESFIVLLPVLSSLVFALHVSRSTATNLVSKRRKLWTCAMITGILHGLAVHTKLYPIIYTVSFMAFFSFQEQPFVPWDPTPYSGWTSVGFRFIQVWSTRLLLRFSSILS